ncbi:MAG TPA: CPXCG motif-containing cysteine-rich protein [Gemmatimonadales bacterium]|nr:CPXCG motif-containing cysteine-rich protein [Gemmatimonadales bacterium]
MGDRGEDDQGVDGWPVDEADVTCPHCGASVQIALDPAGGALQQYIEDCEVCCRPWQVQVQYTGGSVEVSVEAA